MSMTPAFSPGPWMTHGALVGSVRRCRREDLYEQCSFHIAEKMPSSVKVGSRPISVEDALVLVGLQAVFGDEFRRDLAVRCAARSIPLRLTPLGVRRPRPSRATRLSNRPRPSVPPIDGFDQVLRMRHHAEHVDAFAERCRRCRSIEPLGFAVAADLAVGVAIAEGDAALAFEARERLVVGDVVAFAMRDRHTRSPGPAL